MTPKEGITSAQAVSQLGHDGTGAGCAPSTSNTQGQCQFDSAVSESDDARETTQRDALEQAQHGSRRGIREASVLRIWGS